jgi:transcriptional regulator with XRE-family HTH domain
MPDPLVLYLSNDHDARAGAELLLERWPGAELVACTLDEARARSDWPASGPIYLLGLGVSPLDTAGGRVHSFVATPDASIVMQVWQELNPERDPAKTSDRIREIRKASSLTTGDLARKCGVSAALVNHWERGRTEPSKAHLTCIAAATGCRVPWLLGVTDDRQGGFTEKLPPTWLCYLDDAVCGRWELPDSQEVWAWVQSFDDPHEAHRRLTREPWAVIVRFSRDLLRAREMWEEERAGTLTTRDFLRSENTRLRAERDGLRKRLREIGSILDRMEVIDVGATSVASVLTDEQWDRVSELAGATAGTGRRAKQPSR